MKIYYDTEFFEDGRTIDLISIGMVREDGAEYYAVAHDETWRQRIGYHDWHLANTVPYLPVKHEKVPTQGGGVWDYIQWDSSHPDWRYAKPRRTIADEVRDFVLDTQKPELWAWYGAYDHVTLCQLYGPMTDLPDSFPKFTHELKQECERLGNPPLPEQPDCVHKAIADARHVKVRAEYLRDWYGAKSE